MPPAPHQQQFGPSAPYPPHHGPLFHVSQPAQWTVYNLAAYGPPRTPPPAARHKPHYSDSKGHQPQLQSRREGYHAAQAKRQEAAAAANSPNRIKAAAELLPEEQPKLDAVDVEEREELAHKFAAAILAMPSSLARELSHMSLAAGIGNCSPAILQLDACNTFEVADSYQCYFVPVVTPPVQTFGQTGAHAPGYRYSYVWCHGTDISTAASIFKELQASVGELDLHSVQTAVAKELRISKGLQGMLIMGECHTVQPHLKVSWSDTVEESRLCFRRGAIRAKDRWAFNVAFTRIRGPPLPFLASPHRPLQHGHWPTAPAHNTFMPLHPTLGSMSGLAKTIFPCNTFAPYPGPGSQTKASAPEPSANFHHISGHPPASRSPTASGGPGTATPQPPMTLPVPEDWLQDSDYLDTRRSVGNLSCPRHVVSSSWAREKGIAGILVMNLHPAHFLYQGWNSYWLRWIASGKKAYFVVARAKAEMVLAGELLSQIRSNSSSTK
ncbi:unnamed protein product [Symbiodinium necroappetens]|uniref:Uncharacterized protein n=1 Tax=Symbiodinium necroappetens TaxID=1628268 RepID=A0A812IT48_9DINO|nr:unnamed protein product [Symbiodinium necroappetens]